MPRHVMMDCMRKREFGIRLNFPIARLCSLLPFQELPSFVPYTDVDQAERMHPPRGFEIVLRRDAAAIRGAAEGGCIVVNAASVGVEIDAVAVRRMGEHHGAGYERVRFSAVWSAPFLLFKPDHIAPAAERAAVAGDFVSVCMMFHGKRDKKQNLILILFIENEQDLVRYHIHGRSLYGTLVV